MSSRVQIHTAAATVTAQNGSAPMSSGALLSGALLPSAVTYVESVCHLLGISFFHSS